MNKLYNKANIPYEYRQVPIPGGGFVTGFCFHPKFRDILYARTDIGGVYRYDFSVKTWVSLMDHVKATQGWETYPLSIALDPFHPEWLYVVAGDNLQNNYLCRSKDYGNHFDYVKMPVKIHGNAPGRSTGERLMVDPVNPCILYFASQSGGLLISEDYGDTFRELPVKPEGGEAESNLAFIWLDLRSGRNGRCQTIVVSTSGQNNSPGENIRGNSLYISRDAGKTFQVLPGQPFHENYGTYPGFVGQRATFCGNYLFITMAAVDKPLFGWLSYSCDNGGSEYGCILRYELDEQGEILDYTYVTPDLFFMGGGHGKISTVTGFGGIDTVADHPGHLVCSTQCANEEAVLFTTDYGEHWFPILYGLKIGQIDFSQVPYMKPEYNNNQSLIHWLSDVKIDPFYPDRACFNTGTGAFITENLTDGVKKKSVLWSPCCKGMEETVHLNVYSPPDTEVQLIDMVGDLGGFAFKDLTKPAENTFADENNHRYITCINADFPDINPALVVVTARGNWKQKTTGGIILSQDQCRSWKRLPDPMNISPKINDLIQAIRRPNTNSGWVAISANAKTLVWCIADSNSLPADAVVYTVDFGHSWTSSIIFDHNKQKYKDTGSLKVFSDRMDPEVFYGFGDNSDMFISTDGAKSFYQITVPEDFPKLALGTIESSQLRFEIRAQLKKVCVVWIASGSGGLWKIIFHKQSKTADFALITGVGDSVFCVGMGKAAPDSSFDTLYINGVIDSEYGFYRSTKEGRTWERINREHQMYGDVRSIAGDPRIFGRVYIATGSRGVIWGEPSASKNKEKIMKYKITNNRLVCFDKEQIIWVEPWGTNSLRVRVTKESEMDTNDWALVEEPLLREADIRVEQVEVLEPWFRNNPEGHIQQGRIASITNGNITAKFNIEGWLSFENAKGELLTKEYWRNRARIDRYCVPTWVGARELKPITGTSDYKLTARFEAFEGEKIFGMGQYQEGNLDKKGAVLELAQRNSQASVPFMVSSRGYGFLWNNPAIGTASFGTNKTEWIAENTKKMDYWITAGDTPSQIVEQYAEVTGKAPMMPEYGLGFWQCKLRYRNQEELLAVAREHKRLGLPMDVIVVDFFHWTKQGDFKFDPADWPDPEAMVAELKSLGIELMVSVWPTVDATSENREEMESEGMLVKCDRGLNIHMNWMGETAFFDATNPKAQRFVWNRCKENYFSKGIKIFWLDEAEPEYGPYDFDIFRYYKGPALSCSNIYPAMYSKAFYDGMKAEGMENIVNLVRCVWAGSQRYGALAWSGDISSTFRALREQLQAGLNVGMAGIPWWTTDIGGFLGGDITDEKFHELLIRWFEWGTFCPVMRLHGERPPFYPLTEEFRNGVRQFSSGQDNEVWSFGEKNTKILSDYIFLRERLRPYTRKLMQEAHEKGTPVMRTMFYEFPNDKLCWELTDQYMFGAEVLVAPVMEEGLRERSVYLPIKAVWINAYTGEEFSGGQTVITAAPLEVIPVFIKKGFEIEIYNK